MVIFSFPTKSFILAQRNPPTNPLLVLLYNSDFSVEAVIRVGTLDNIGDELSRASEDSEF